jgi:hypothetical protein
LPFYFTNGKLKIVNLFLFVEEVMCSTFSAIIKEGSKYMDFPVEHLISNPNLTWDLVETLPQYTWDTYLLSRHPCVTPAILQKYPEKDWNYSFLSENPSMFSYIQSHPDKEWNWYTLSKNPKLTWDFVMQHIHEDWDWSALTVHPNISFDTIVQNSEHEWDWAHLGRNPNVTPEIVQAHPKIGWHFRELSQNASMTYEFVQSCRHEHWDGMHLSWKLSFPTSFKVDDPWFWNMYLLSRNPTISWEAIQARPNEFRWHFLSRNPRLAEYILKYPSMPWEPEGLASNPALFGKVLNWKGLSQNPALTYPFFCEHIHADWDPTQLSQNLFVHDPYVAASRIRRAYDSYKMKYRLPLVAIRSITNDMIRYRPHTGIEYQRALAFFEQKEWLNEVF